MLFIIYSSYISLIQPLLATRAGIQKCFVGFMVQMKSLEFTFEIKWPLEVILLTTGISKKDEWKSWMVFFVL